MKFTKIIKDKTFENPITHITRMGGYWYVNKKFPFIHFEKEFLIVITSKGLYKLEKEPLKEKDLKNCELKK